LHASFLAGAREPGRVLEDLDDFGRRKQDDRAPPAGALGVGGEHLHPVARPQALGHVARVHLDRKLYQAGLPAGGEHELGGDQRIATHGSGQDPARYGPVGARSQVVP
jgi:hypothetical protein